MGIGLERFDWFVAHVLAGTLDEDAAREGFAPSFLEAVAPAQLTQVAASLKEALASGATERRDYGPKFEVIYGDLAATGAVDATAPHQFIGLLFRPVAPAPPVNDERLTRAPLTAEGAPVVDALRAAYTKHGLIGAVAAEFGADGAEIKWRAAIGYSDLEAEAPCELDTRMLAGSISKLLVATLALQLVGEGSLDLDTSANDYLRTLRVASDAVTIRHLLTHTGGVSSDFEHFVEVAPPAVEILGQVVALDFEPGSQREYSNGGYTVLGELIAEITGQSIENALATRVLEPLGMRDSSFATRWPDDVGPGYAVEDGRAVAMAKLVPSVPAAGGLVTTTRDLGRFVAGWRSLVPADLAQQALSPQASRPDGGQQGFGWLIGDEVVGHTGGTLTYSSSLLWWRSGRLNVLMTNRAVPAEPINAALQA